MEFRFTSFSDFSELPLISTLRISLGCRRNSMTPSSVLYHIRQKSSDHTDLLHAWHLCPNRIIVWICRGLIPNGSKKQHRNTSSPNICRFLLHLHLVGHSASFICILVYLFLFFPFWYILRHQPSHKTHPVSSLTIYGYVSAAVYRLEVLPGWPEYSVRHF